MPEKAVIDPSTYSSVHIIYHFIKQHQVLFNSRGANYQLLETEHQAGTRHVRGSKIVKKRN